MEGGERIFVERTQGVQRTDRRQPKVSTHPAVSLPIILVPAIVAWHMGITSCSSASKTLEPLSQPLTAQSPKNPISILKLSSYFPIYIEVFPLLGS